MAASQESNDTPSSEARPSYRPYIPTHPIILRQELLVLIGLVAFLVLFRLQIFQEFGSAFAGGYRRDAGLYVWLVKSNWRDFFTLDWFNTRAFHPYTRTLAWSDNFLLPSFLVGILTSLGTPLVCAYNTVLLGAGVLSGYFTYRLCYRLSGQAIISLCAGVLFMNASSVVGQLGHPQLQFTFWIPLSVTLLIHFLAQPSVTRAFFFSLTVPLCFLTTVYYAVFIPVLALAILAAQMMLRPYQFRQRAFALLFLGSLPSILLLLPFLYPYMEVKDMFGGRGLYEPYYFAATALSYAAFSPLNFGFSWTSRLAHPEAWLGSGFVLLGVGALCANRLFGAKQLRKLTTVFLGCFTVVLLFTSLRPVCRLFYPDTTPGSGICSIAFTRPIFLYVAALALWGAVVSFGLLLYRMGALERKLGFNIMTNRGLIATFLFPALIFFALSLGPLGNPAKGEFAPGFYTVFYYLFPGFSSIRAVSRAGIVVIFCLCVLFSFTTDLLRKHSSKALLFSFTLFAIALLENVFTDLPREPEHERSVVFDQLQGRIKPGEAVIVLPLAGELKPNGTVKSWGEFAELNVQYMHWAFPLQASLVNGYSGLRSKFMKEFPRRLSNFPDRRSVNVLRFIQGVKYVVYVSSKVPDFNYAAFRNKITQQASHMSFLGGDPSGNYLFELTGQVKVDDAYYLRTPSTPGSYLHLELMAHYEINSPKRGIEIYEEDHLDGGTFGVVNISADGKWHQFSILLPEVANTARPFRIKFRRSRDFKLFLKSSTLSFVESVQEKETP